MYFLLMAVRRSIVGINTGMMLELIRLEEENPEDDIIEDLSDPFDISTSLDFLDGDNTSLYLAFKAYHQDQDFESAANHFQQSLAYAQDNGKEDMQVSQSGSIRVSEPDDSQAKSKYWLAESYLKIKQSDLAVDLFQDLVNNLIFFTLEQV